MSNKHYGLAAVSAVTATVLVLSPVWAPQVVLASTSSFTLSPNPIIANVDMPTSFTLTPTVGLGIKSGDTYQIQMAVSNPVDGTLTTDLPYEQPIVAGHPMQPGQSVTSVVYSVYGSYLNSGSGIPITLVPMDVGNYQASIQVYDQSTNTTVGDAVYAPLQVQAQPNLGSTDVTFGDISSSVNTMFYFQQAISPDPVVYHLQVVHASNSISATSADIASLQYDISGPNGDTQPTNLTLTDGVTTFSNTTFPTTFTNENLNLTMQFNTPDTYDVILTTLDKNTGQVLDVRQTQVSVGTPNVTFDVKNGAGTDVSGKNVTVSVQSPSGTQTDFSTSSSTPTAYLPPLPDGQQYQVVGINDGSYISLNSPIPFTVGNSGTTVNVTEPAFLTGTITSDGTAPIPNAIVALYPVSAQGTPDENGQPVIISSGPDGSFSQQIQIGHYVATTMSFSSNGQSYQVGVNTTVNVAQSGVTHVTFHPTELYIDQAQTTVEGRDDWHPLLINPSLQLPQDVYFKVSVMKGSTPVTSGVNIQAYPDTSPPLTFTLGSDGTATAGKNQPVNSSTITNLNVLTNFADSGLYTLKFTIMNASNDQTVASTTQNVNVEAPNVTGTVVATDGLTPVAYDSVNLQATNGQSASLLADQQGAFRGFLPDGTWQVTSLQSWDQATQQSQNLDVTGQNVTFTIDSAHPTATGITVKDTSMNAVGIAYEDSGNSTALKNGFISLVPSGAPQGAQPYFANTDSAGHFAMQLPAGTYTVTQEGNMDMFQELNEQITIPSSGSIIVAPNPPTFEAPVKDAFGQPVTSGYVGVLPGSGVGPDTDYSQAIWLPIHSDGVVSGDLTDGDYIAFALSSQTSSYPLNVQFTITNGQLATSNLVIQPPQAKLRGMLTDSSGTPLENAAILVAPTGSTDPSQYVTLFGDQNGNFTDLGVDNQGNFGSVLHVGTKYTVLQVYSNTGSAVLNENMPALAAGDVWSLQIPGADLTGSVKIDGAVVQNGAVAFEPSGTTQPGQNVIWAQISGGTFQASLPKGSYQVFGVGDDATQQFYNENTYPQTPIQITNPSQSVQQALNFSDNFAGTLDNNGTPVQNAWIAMSPTDPNTGQFDGSKVQYLQTDGSGNFSGYLTPGQWYIISVGTQTGSTQTDIPETVGTTATPNFTVNMTPNVQGTVNGLGAVQSAWVEVQKVGSTQTYNTSVDTSTGDFTMRLPDGTYNIVGVGTEGSGQQSWVDLTSQDKQFTTSESTTATPSVTLPQQVSGSVTGQTGVTYIVLQSKADSTKQTTVAVSPNGQYSTALSDSDWTVVGAETADHYYSATGTLAGGVTVGTVIQ